MKTKNEKYRQLLKETNSYQSDSLKSAVLSVLLESEDPISFANDVNQYGCISGVVSSLIYYQDTHAFFNRYYEEIELLRFNYEEQIGESIIQYIKGDLKNGLAWFAFEETARQLLSDLEVSF